MKASFPMLMAGLILTGYQPQAQDFWKEIPYPNTAEPMSCFGLNSNERLFAGQPSNIYYTDDMGENWFTTTNWPGYSPTEIVINASDPIFISTVFNGIMRSVNNRITFAPANTGLPNDWILELAPGDDGKILAGIRNNQIYCSLDYGQTWNPLQSGYQIPPT